MSISLVLALPEVESTTPTAKNPRLMRGLCLCDECMPIPGHKLEKVIAVSAPKQMKTKKMRQKNTLIPELSFPPAIIIFTMNENRALGSNGTLIESHIRKVFGKSRIRYGRETKIHPASRCPNIPIISQDTEASLAFFGSSTDFQTKTVKDAMEKVFKKTKIKPGFSLSTYNRFSILKEKQAPGSNGTLTNAQIRMVFGYSQIRKGRETKTQPLSGGSKIRVISQEKNKKKKKGGKPVEKRGVEENLDEPQDSPCIASSISSSTSHLTVATQEEPTEAQENSKVKSTGQCGEAKVH